MTSDELDALDRLLKSNEGFRPYLYDDATGKRITQGSTVVGHPTWGWGFNTDAIDFTVEAAQVQFDTIRTRRINEVFNALPWTQRLGSGPLRAVIDIAYNAGVDGLMQFHKMLDCLQRGDLVGAKREVLNSKLAEGRARRLAALILL